MNLELDKITTGLPCTKCGSKNTFLRHGAINKGVQLHYCWDCHLPFSKLGGVF